MGDAKLMSPIAFIHIFLRKIYDNNYFTLKAFIPGYTAEAPSSSSILKSWLYLATRSDLDGAPVLIWQVFKATARSAIVVSAVSPDLCDEIAVYPAL